MQKKISPKLKKFLIILPIFLIGIVALFLILFNLLDGTSKPLHAVKPKNAFNKKLPDPNLPSTSKNKLEIYLQAEKDSLKQKADWERDTNMRKLYDPLPPGTASILTRPQKRLGQTTPPRLPLDPNEQKVNDRLKKLYAAINQSPYPETATNLPAKMTTGGNPDIDRLQKLLQSTRTPDTSTDPTLDRVEKILDKVITLQHPDRLTRATGTSKPDAPSLFYLSATPPEQSSEIKPNRAKLNLSNHFYGLNDLRDLDTVSSPASFQAIVPEDQSVQNGSTLKLRLLQDLYVGHSRIPANTPVYGVCTVSNERLQVQLSSLICNGQIYPIALKVYDLDGLAGIYVPGAVTRDVTKDGIGQGIGSMDLATVAPTPAGQAAAAGVETAKNLLSKKIKAVIVTIRAGHHILLQPSHN